MVIGDMLCSHCSYILYRGKFLRTINFIVFEDFASATKINSSKSYYSIESYGSLVDPRNLICDMYRKEIMSKITCYTVASDYVRT